MKEKEVEVLLVQPEKYPKKVSISRGLESLQKKDRRAGTTKKLGRGMQRLGFAMMLLSVALALTNL